MFRLAGERGFLGIFLNSSLAYMFASGLQGVLKQKGRSHNEGQEARHCVMDCFVAASWPIQASSLESLWRAQVTCAGFVGRKLSLHLCFPESGLSFREPDR